jgi:hypothetical protein
LSFCLFSQTSPLQVDKTPDLLVFEAHWMGDSLSCLGCIAMSDANFVLNCKRLQQYLQPNGQAN